MFIRDVPRVLTAMIWYEWEIKFYVVGERQREREREIMLFLNMGFKYTSLEFNTTNIYRLEYLEFDPYSLSNLDTYFIPSNY